ncbi:MAG: putative single-stranded DNA-binding protein, partial [Pseudomonadota bacterium]
KYTGQDGIERNTVDIIATELQLLGGREGMGGGGGGEDDGAPRRAPAAAPRAPAPAPRAQTRPAGPADIDDDIPF